MSISRNQERLPKGAKAAGGLEKGVILSLHEQMSLCDKLLKGVVHRSCKFRKMSSRLSFLVVRAGQVVPQDSFTEFNSSWALSMYKMSSNKSAMCSVPLIRTQLVDMSLGANH